MWNKLRQQPLVGLALAIAAGYLLARVALTVFRLGVERLRSEWTDGSSYGYDPILTTTIGVLSILLVSIWIGRRFGLKIRAFCSKYRNAIAGAFVFLVIGGFITGLSTVSQQRDIKAATPTSNPNQSIAAQMIADGSLPDKPAIVPVTDEIRKSYLQFKKHNADYEGTLSEYKQAAANGLLAQYHSVRKIDAGLCTFTVPGYYTDRQIEKVLQVFQCPPTTAP